MSLDEQLNNLNLNELKNSDILCVTTFTKKLYDEYSYRFLDTYNLPYDLTIYSEDNLDFLKEKITKFTNINIKLINSYEKIKELVSFVNCNNSRNKKDVNEGGFRKDGVRFCYKVFVVTDLGLDIIKQSKYKYLIWLDADIIFKKPIEIDLLKQKLIDNNTMMSYLGRGLKYHSECGFLIFNLSHSKIKEYFEEMMRMYVSNDIYKEREWHDSYIWDVVRKKFETKFKIKNKNIGSKDKTINDIIGNTFLFEYFYHLKGKRKYDYKNN